MTLKSFSDPHGNTTEARQALLDRATERSHPKRHRTQKRAKVLSKKKRQAAEHKRAVNDARRRHKLAAARSYWRGERDEHPK